jgi:hypothetical protein
MNYIDYQQLYFRLLELSEDFSCCSRQNTDPYLGIMADKLKTLAKEMSMKEQNKP